MILKDSKNLDYPKVMQTRCPSPGGKDLKHHGRRGSQNSLKESLQAMEIVYYLHERIYQAFTISNQSGEAAHFDLYEMGVLI